jgi:hypothetical protein
VDIATTACAVDPAPLCEVQPAAADAPLCGHTPEQFAEVALALEPRGIAWCRLFTTTKSALYRAFGRLLADMEQRMCDLFEESLACNSVELLAEWEIEYGLPGECAAGSYPTDLAGRQAQVCAARRSTGISTRAQLQALLRIALDCPLLTIDDILVHSWMGRVMGQPLTVHGGICVRGIGPADLQTTIHNVVGGWGLMSDGAGSAVGQPLTLNDPAFVQPDMCPVIYHSTMGGWTGGMGSPLMVADPVKWGLLVCLMTKHLPAHVVWTVCP